MKTGKKVGAPKIVSWEDAFEDKYLERLMWGLSRETLEEECKWLAEWYRGQKIPAPGTKHGISASRIQEKLRERNIDAKVYRAERTKCIERLLRAARAFLEKYDYDIPDSLNHAGQAFLFAHQKNSEN
jgi:hypothetical protein